MALSLIKALGVLECFHIIFLFSFDDRFELVNKLLQLWGFSYRVVQNNCNQLVTYLESIQAITIVFCIWYSN